jgi:cytochrome c oxidase subunit 4
LTYLALLALLALNIASTYMNLGNVKPWINVSIAAAMTALIIVFLMHVSQNSSLVRLFAAGGFFWLIFMFSLTLSDYLTRPSGYSVNFPTIEESASTLEAPDKP